MEPEDKDLEMPKFEPEIIEVDEGTVSRMQPTDRMMHESYTNIRKEQSVRRQQIGWLKEHIIRLDKTARELKRDRKTVVHLPYRIIGWLVVVIGAAIVTKIIEMVFTKK